VEKKEILERLKTVKENKDLTDDDKAAVDEAIRLYKAKNWRDNLLRIVELLAKLFGIGSKFIDP
jgi:hypothetical protein